MGKSREETRRKFQEALDRIYFPAAPSPHLSISQEATAAEDENKDEGTRCETDPHFDSPGEGERSENEGKVSPLETRERKMTRSQRKRLRKRKLKELGAAGARSDQRRKIIGPMLASGYLRGEGSESVEKENLTES